MYEMVALSAQSPSTVRVFLSALKRFYFSVLVAGEYPRAHPLTNPVVHLLQEVDQEDTDVRRSRPKMPPESGIEEPQRKRLCKSIGIDLNIHWLRHWHVSQMIQKVVEIRPRSTREAPSKDQIQQVLQAVLMGSESPPLSLFAIARRLRCDVHLLTQYDRQACQAISAQYRAYRGYSQRAFRGNGHL